MRALAYLFLLLSFAGAGMASWWLATQATSVIETQTRETVRMGLSAAAQDWPRLRVNGTQVIIAGAAPTEAAGFRALEVARGIVGADNLTNSIAMGASEQAEEEVDLTLTLVINADAITVLGAIPDSLHDMIAQHAADSARQVIDLTDPVERDAPAALTYNLRAALDVAPLIETGRVVFGPRGAAVIEAALIDADGQAEIEARVRASTPPGTAVSLELATPPPMLAPYPFSARKRADGLEIAACAVPDNATQGRIAMAAGVGDPDCTRALGAPRDWDDAITAVLAALAALPTAEAVVESQLIELTMGARTTTEQSDAVLATLRAALPEGYTVVTTQRALPNEVPNPRSAMAAEPFSATRDDSAIQLSGALTDLTAIETVLSYAESAFSGLAIEPELEVDTGADTTPVASAIAAIEATTLLLDGTAVAGPTRLTVTGRAPGQGTADQLAETLAARLPADVEIRIEVEQIPIEIARLAPEPSADPDLCLMEVQQIQTPDARIEFAPSSANLDLSSAQVLDALSTRLRQCPDLPFIVAGYTDNQGREALNQRISASRANAVLDALLARGVFLDRMRAVGLGEADPVADNETEEGRALNRRIEFLPADAIPPAEPEAQDPPEEASE